jgi:hypothetical protein
MNFRALEYNVTTWRCRMLQVQIRESCSKHSISNTIYLGMKTETIQFLRRWLWDIPNSWPRPITAATVELHSQERKGESIKKRKNLRQARTWRIILSLPIQRTAKCVESNAAPESRNSLNWKNFLNNLNLNLIEEIRSLISVPPRLFHFLIFFHLKCSNCYNLPIFFGIQVGENVAKDSDGPRLFYPVSPY